MKSVEELGQLISTDVLVLGGGLAGLCAAIKARESHVNVLVLDKGGIGWAGQVPISAGRNIYISPERVGEWFQWAVEDGVYLNNQDWTYTFVHELHGSIMELADLGVPFVKSKGVLAILPFEKQNDQVAFDGLKSMQKLKGAARARGVQTLDKVYVIDLLRRDSKVVGAIGFGLVDGKTYIFNARAVIIAVGSCRYQHERSFAVCAGEGPVMAYRAGAQMMNAEFANNYTVGAPLVGKQLGRGPAPWLENALGEKIMEKYYPEVTIGRTAGETGGEKAGQGRRDYRQMAEAMVKEVEAGRGPIYLDMSKLTPEERNIARGAAVQILPHPPLLYAFTLLEEKAGMDLDTEKIEVRPMLVGGQGPIRIDVDCRTTVVGLWAAGDAPSLGSGWSGARASGTHGGRGLAFALVSGLIAGKSAGRYAATSQELEIDYEEAKKVKERVFAPLDRGGDLDIHNVIYQVHEAMVPTKYNFHREAGRLKEALTIIENAKQNLKRVGASDHHELSCYHQAESMALSAELSLKAALMREETRGSHVREDFPKRDDKNWLKWIVIKEKDGVPQFSTEPLPMDKYKLKP